MILRLFLWPLWCIVHLYERAALDKRYVFVFVCYLHGRGVDVVVAGSTGVRCLCETQGRRGQGKSSLMECSVKHLDEEDKKKDKLEGCVPVTFLFCTIFPQIKHGNIAQAHHAEQEAETTCSLDLRLYNGSISLSFKCPQMLLAKEFSWNHPMY